MNSELTAPRVIDGCWRRSEHLSVVEVESTSRWRCYKGSNEVELAQRRVRDCPDRTPQALESDVVRSVSISNGASTYEDDLTRI